MRRRSTAMRGSLGGSSSADALAPNFRRAQLERHHATSGARHHVHAREAGPLAVAGKDPRRVLGLDPAALDRRADLEQPEVADDTAVVAAEPLRPDEADRVGTDAALALEPGGGRVGGQAPETLRVERATDADQRCRL